jgi:hypothetical protein
VNICEYPMLRDLTSYRYGVNRENELAKAFIWKSKLLLSAKRYKNFNWAIIILSSNDFDIMELVWSRWCQVVRVPY